MSIPISFKRGSSAALSGVNPLFLAGELVYEIDTLKVKIGDGTSLYNDLPFIFSGVYLQNLVEDISPALGNHLNINNFNISGTGNIDISGDIAADSGNFTSLFVNNTEVALSGHNHTSSQITDFGSSVSGLLPVVDILAGSGISVLSNSSIFTISVTGTFGLTSEEVDDRVAELLQPGTGISLDYNDNLDILTINTIGLQPSGDYSVVGHSHIITDISGLQNALDNKQPAGVYAPLVRGYEILSENKTVFSTEQSYISGNLDVYQNGIKLLINDDYTANGGSSFTLTNPAISGDTVEWITGYAGGESSIESIGSGITNYSAKWNSDNTLTSGMIFDTGSRIGIGTSAPLKMIHVVNPGTGTSITQDATLLLSTQSSGSYSSLWFNNFQNQNVAFFQYSNPAAGAFANQLVMASRLPDIPVIFYQGGITQQNKRLSLDTSGNILLHSNVGINNENPLYTLDVSGTGHFTNVRINNSYTFPDSDGLSNQYLKTDGAGNLSWSTVSGVSSSATEVSITGSATIPYINISGAGSVTVSLDGSLVTISGSSTEGSNSFVKGYEIVSISKSLFDIGGTYTSGNLDVYYNGFKLLIDDDYTANGGSTFTLTTAATSGDIVEWIAGYTGSTFVQSLSGSGVSNYLSKWDNSTSLTSGLIYDNGSGIGIGTSSPVSKLHLVGDCKIDGNLTVANIINTIGSNGNSGATQTISLNNGAIQTYTLTDNCAFTMPTVAAGQSFRVFLNTGTGGYTATFSGVLWLNSIAPTITTTASKVDILDFVSDGSYWYGSYSQNYG